MSSGKFLKKSENMHTGADFGEITFHPHRKSSNTLSSRFILQKTEFNAVRTDLTFIQLLSVLGLPALVVAVSLAATQGRGYADIQSCWLSTRNYVLWAFVAPALLIVSVSFGCCFIRVTIMLCPQLSKTFCKLHDWNVIFFSVGKRGCLCSRYLQYALKPSST